MKIDKKLSLEEIITLVTLGIIDKEEAFKMLDEGSFWEKIKETPLYKKLEGLNE